MNAATPSADDLVAVARGFLVRLEAGRGGGAGVVWAVGNGRSLIATCAHVVPNGWARVIRADGSAADARVVARDPWRDAALLATRTADEDVAALLAPEEELRPGQLVATIGHPLGLRAAVAIGILHSLDRAGAHGPVRWLRADLRLRPGNSGGPLLDARGRLLGVCALIARGLAHAVPAAAFSLLAGALCAAGRGATSPPVYPGGHRF